MKRSNQIRGARLQQLRSEARLQERLSALILSKLPDEFAPHCHAATLREGTLTLMVSSGAWASRLRFYQQELLTAVNESLGADTTQFKAKVVKRSLVASPNLSAPRPKDAPGITETVADQLMAVAMTENDPELAEVLARLASRVESP